MGQYRTIPESGQGKNARIACMLEDQGTCMAMDQYISSAGKHANSDGLAQAVTDTTGRRYKRKTIYVVNLNRHIKSLLKNCSRMVSQKGISLVRSEKRSIQRWT